MGGGQLWIVIVGGPHSIEWFAIEGWWCVFCVLCLVHTNQWKDRRTGNSSGATVLLHCSLSVRCALDRTVFKTVLLGHRVFTGCSIDERFQPSERRNCCLSSLDDWSTVCVRHLHTCTCWCSSSHHGANKTSTSTGSCLADAFGWCVLSVCSYIGNPCA